MRARLDRDFGEGAVPAPQGGAAYRALDELSWGGAASPVERQGPALDRRAPVGDLRAAACVTARRVRADGQHQAGRVRDGAGHAALGTGRADDRDGPVHQVHPRASGDARVDEERRRRLGAVRGAQPARGPGGLAAGGGLALSRGARDAGRGRGHGAGAAVLPGLACCPTLSWSTTAASICPIMSPARAPGWGSRSSRPALTRRPTNLGLHTAPLRSDSWLGGVHAGWTVSCRRPWWGAGGLGPGGW